MSTNPAAYNDVAEATPVPSSQQKLTSGPRKKLSWFRLDIEQRFGMRGGRFTRVNNLFACAVALLLTVAVYAAMLDSITMRPPPDTLLVHDSTAVFTPPRPSGPLLSTANR
jgi:hypothetical protein